MIQRRPISRCWPNICLPDKKEQTTSEKRRVRENQLFVLRRFLGRKCTGEDKNSFSLRGGFLEKRSGQTFSADNALLRKERAKKMKRADSAQQGGSG